MSGMRNICINLMLTLHLVTNVVDAQLLVNGGFERDTDRDNLPDGWYDFRGAELTGVSFRGRRALRLVCREPGVPAWVSQSFPVKGEQVKWLQIILWVQGDRIEPGPTVSHQPCAFLNFVGADGGRAGFARVGPWSGSFEWTKMERIVKVPAGTREAYLTIGLFGAIGEMTIDEVSVVPAYLPEPVLNLIDNGSFEEGTLVPDRWLVTGEAVRVMGGVSPGSAAVRLGPRRAATGQTLCIPVNQMRNLIVRWSLKGIFHRYEIRGSVRFFSDRGAEVLNRPFSLAPNRSGGWTTGEFSTAVPKDAVTAFVSFETDGGGPFYLDDVIVYGLDAQHRPVLRSRLVPLNTKGWSPFSGIKEIADGSGWDLSFLLDPPAGKRGFATCRDGGFVFQDGTPARFWGVSLLPTAAFPDRSRASQLADRLAKLGCNLVQFNFLDAPLEVHRSLMDLCYEESGDLCPIAWDRLDYFISELKKKGIYLSLQFFSSPEAFGPVFYQRLSRRTLFAFLDRPVRYRQRQWIARLLLHINPYTGLPLARDPTLAWVSLMDEGCLIHRVIAPAEKDDHLVTSFLKLFAQKRTNPGIPPESFALSLEDDYFSEMASFIKDTGWGGPISPYGCRHRLIIDRERSVRWDFIEDHLFWSPPPFATPPFQSVLFNHRSDYFPGALVKFRENAPYVVSQWAAEGYDWGYQYEGADLLLMAIVSSALKWDGVARAGILSYPEPWGDHIVGSSGSDEWENAPFVMNSMPHLLLLFPIASLIFHRDGNFWGGTKRDLIGNSADHDWNVVDGVLTVRTPWTDAVAGFIGDRIVNTSQLTIRVRNLFAAVAATSLTEEPLTLARRILLVAVSRSGQRGLRYVNHLQRQIADPGEPPLLMEPVEGEIVLPPSWATGPLTVYPLRTDGSRRPAVPTVLLSEPRRHALKLPTDPPAFVFEIVRGESR